MSLCKDDQKTKRLLSVPIDFNLSNFLKQKKRKLRISNGCQTVPSFPNFFQKIMSLFNKHSIKEILSKEMGDWKGNCVQY